MFEIDDIEIKEFEKDLKAFADRAFPFATKATLNKAAFTAQKLARRDVSVKMVERNKFTQQSIQVNQARTLNVRLQSATVGSTADYMKDQEFGAVERKGGSEGVSIPTGYSAGQEGQQTRTRVPRKANKLQNIRLKNKSKKGSNRKQRTLLAVRQAVDTGNRFIFLDLGKRKGIFKVLGGRKKSSRGWPKGARLKMVHDLTRQSVRIPRNPWLKPAVDRTQILMPGFYRDALIFQLKRQGLFQG